MARATDEKKPARRPVFFKPELISAWQRKQLPKRPKQQPKQPKRQPKQPKQRSKRQQQQRQQPEQQQEQRQPVRW
jgi:hypothetical protein